MIAYMPPVAIITYCALAAEFLTRYTWDRPMRPTDVPGGAFRGIVDIRLKRMLYAMFVMTVLIVIRYTVHLFCLRLIANGV